MTEKSGRVYGESDGERLKCSSIEKRSGKGASEMIREIYASMVCKNYDGEKISGDILDEIEELLKSKKGKMDGQEYMQYQDELKIIAAAAEESGFVEGFAFAFRLFAEIIQE